MDNSPIANSPSDKVSAGSPCAVAFKLSCMTIKRTKMEEGEYFRVLHILQENTEITPCELASAVGGAVLDVFIMF